MIRVRQILISTVFPLAAATLSLAAGCASHEAGQATMTKHITVSFCVEPDASVSHAHVVGNDPAGPALDGVALKVIRQWKFYPARDADGKPVRRCGVTQDIVFKIPTGGGRSHPPVAAVPGATARARCLAANAKPLTPCAMEQGSPPRHR